MIIILTRPYEESKRLKTELLNYYPNSTILIEPIIQRKKEFVNLSNLTQYEGIITTSSYSIEVLASLTAERNFSLYCVGESSKESALKLGFKNVYAGFGSVDSLIPILENDFTRPSNLLYLHGDIIRKDLKNLLSTKGYHVDSKIIYSTSLCPKFEEFTLNHLPHSKKIYVLLYSPRTTQHFIDLCKKAQIPLDCLSYLCLSKEVAQPLIKIGLTDVDFTRIIKKDILISLLNQKVVYDECC